jgi:hypothetical protein
MPKIFLALLAAFTTSFLADLAKDGFFLEEASRMLGRCVGCWG